MSTTIHAAVGVLLEWRQDAWCCLIARRPRDTVLSGYWELPGGKVEPGESAAQCLVREFREELGLAIEVGRPVPGGCIEHRYDHGRVRIEALFCTRRTGTPRNIAVTAHRWVTAAELPDYRFPPANDALMRQIAVEMAAAKQVDLNRG